MPTTDVIKVALIVLLVGALAGLVSWFALVVVPDVVSTGSLASSTLETASGDAWRSVSGVFGLAWGNVWSVTLAFVLSLLGIFWLVRIVKWVHGA